MPQQTPQLKISTSGQTTVVELTPKKILDELSIMQLGQQLYALAAKDPNPRLALDFANVAHMSSSALGVLITLHKRVREKGGRMVLCNIQPAIFEIFAITRLNEIFSIHNSKQEALAALE